ncbi:MAG: IS66 family transposase [Chloroflexi bacterium]|nr:IS66 family transposase [Chloroflexota bacterium]
MDLETASRVELLEIVVAQQATIRLLEARIAEQQAIIAALTARVKELEHRLSTDSHNSSKPPSSDGPGAKPHPKSQRMPSGRKPGGQPGHRGQTLKLVDRPDEVQVHAPSHCEACGRSLEAVPAIRRERRQEMDLPPVRVWVVEHQAETKCCPGCGAETVGEFPAGVVAPIQYGPGAAAVAVSLNQAQLLPLERTGEALAELFGCPMADGTVEHAVGVCHKQVAEVEAAIKQGIEAADVAHFDETGINVGGKTSWLHVASTPSLTFSAAHPKRGRAALDEVGLLGSFLGRAVHDGLSTYWHYGQCEHALCNAHHLRELTFVAEELGQEWAKDLKDVLLEIKHAVDDARDRGLDGLAAEVKHEFERRYNAMLEEGHRANPQPGGSAGGAQGGDAGLHGRLLGAVRQ